MLCSCGASLNKKKKKCYFGKANFYTLTRHFLKFHLIGPIIEISLLAHQMISIWQCNPRDSRGSLIDSLLFIIVVLCFSSEAMLSCWKCISTTTKEMHSFPEQTCYGIPDEERTSLNLNAFQLKVRFKPKI